MYLAHSQFYPLQNGGENGLKLGRQKRPLLRLNTNQILAFSPTHQKAVAVATAVSCAVSRFARLSPPPGPPACACGVWHVQHSDLKDGRRRYPRYFGRRPDADPPHTYGMAAWRGGVAMTVRM